MRSCKDRPTFGIIVDWINGWEEADYYQLAVISGITDFAKAHDTNIICFVTGRLGSPFEWERSRNVLFDFIDHNKIDGLILLPSAISIYGDSNDVLEKLKSFSGLPIVTINSHFDGYHSVSATNHSGMKQIVDHLIEEHSCRHIAFIKGPDKNNEAETRFQAYIDSLAVHAIPYDETIVFEGNFLFDSGVRAVRTLMEENIPFDALVCSNDNMAIGAMSELYAFHGNAPVNIPITGFDDITASRYHSLTTVKQSFYEEAWSAASILLKLINDEAAPIRVEIPTQMMLRSSCGCISDSIINASTENVHPTNGTFDQAFRQHRTRIISELTRIGMMSHRNTFTPYESKLLKLEEQLLDSFYDDFYNRTDGKFLSCMNTLVLWVASKKMTYAYLEDLLSSLRREILPLIGGYTRIIDAENLFHQGRVLISETIQRTSASMDYLISFQDDIVEQMSEELMSSLEIPRQMDVIASWLPRYDLKNCYVALFHDTNAKPQLSRLALAYNGNRMNVDDELSIFPSHDLLPDAVFDDLGKERFNIVIQLLHQGSSRSGYIIFDYQDKVSKLHEMLRHSISIAVNASLQVSNHLNRITAP